MLCYRCGGHVKDGSDKCPSCGQPFALGLKPGSIAGFGTGSRRGRAAIEGAPYKIDDAVAARFQIKDHLGAGPLGWVFRAVDTENGESVAFKVLSPRFLQLPEEQSAFRSELERMHAIEHANISRTIASGFDGPRPWIATQLLDGLTLRRIMDLRRQKGQGFALIEIEPIVAQIASALDASPVAHGNLKPDNVVVLPDLLKLTDFGLALCLPRSPFVAAQRAAGMQRYFAPEILAGAALGGRADVFSLGVILGELLAGAPFDPHIEDRMRAAGVPEAVERVFLRAVAPRLEDRFSSAADLSQALSDAIHGDAMPAAAHADGAVESASDDDVEVIAEDDDVVIEHTQTDPRVRIARALAAQDAERSTRAQIDAETRRAQASHGKGAHGLQLSLTPLPPLSVPPLSLPPLSMPPLSLPPLDLEQFLAPVQPRPSQESFAAALQGASDSAAAKPAAQIPPAASGSLELHPPASTIEQPQSAARTNEPALAPALFAATTPSLFAATSPANFLRESHSATEPLDSAPNSILGERAVAAEGIRSHATPAEIARVAARVGATPELLTAETAVRFAPKAPPGSGLAASAPAVPTTPLIAATAITANESASGNSSAPAVASHHLSSASEHSSAVAATPNLASAAAPEAGEIAHPAPLAARAPVDEVLEISDFSEVSEVSDSGADRSEPPAANGSSSGSEDVAVRGKRRGRGRRGKREEGRGRRSLDSVPPVHSSAATATGAQTHAPEPLPSARIASLKPIEAHAENGRIESARAAAIEAPRAVPPAEISRAGTNGFAAHEGAPSAPESAKPARAVEAKPAAEIPLQADRSSVKPALPPPAPIESRPPPALSRPPASPSFGALTTEKRGPSVPMLAIGAVLVIAAAAFAWNQFSNRAPAEKPPAAESAAAAPASALPSPTPANANPAAPSGTSATPAAPAPAESARAKETARPEPVREPARDLDERPSSKGGKKSFLERLRERRDASKHSHEHASAESTHAEPSRAESSRVEAASARAETHAEAAEPQAPEPVAARKPALPATAAAPSPAAPQAAAPAPSSAPAAAAASANPAPGTPGGISGIGDDNVMASRDPETRKRAAAELATAAGAGAKEAPAAAAVPTPSASEPCPDGMQLIVGGTAHIGTDPSDDMRNFGDRAAGTVQLKPYCIDLYEWPNAPGRAPKIAAGFSEADSSCKKAGKRLCTEDEWEKACKGPANLRFPYGSAFDPDVCNTQDKATNPRHISASGTFATCKSGYGVYDLSGNAAEWTSSSFEGASADKAVKGGNASRPGFDDRCSSRRRLAANSHDINVGFRCCSDAK